MGTPVRRPVTSSRPKMPRTAQMPPKIAATSLPFFFHRNTSALVFGILSAVVGVSGLLHVTGIFPDFPFLTYGIPAVLSCYFDLFSGFVQAYVFTLLTMVYIAGSLPEPDAAKAA